MIVPELKNLDKGTIPSFRAAIYIRDEVYLFRPKEEAERMTARPSTRGRRLSIRFGIVGRAWRLGTSDYDPDVSTDPDELVKNWGVTHEEAKTSGQGRKSFVVFLIRNSENHAVGVMFLDAVLKDLFGTEASFKKINSQVADEAIKDGLAKALFTVSQELRKHNPSPIRR